MTPRMTDAARWQDANRRSLAAELDGLRHALKRRLGEAGDPPAEPPPFPPGFESALDRLCQVFDLSGFERFVLLLAAGVEFASDIATLCARAQGAADRSHASFSLALALAPEAHWSAIAPSAPLRYWRLIRVDDTASSLTAARLVIEERILHFLSGLDDPDEALRDRSIEAQAGVLTPSQQITADRIVRAWADADAADRDRPLAILTGPDPATRRLIALGCCSLLQAEPLILPLAAFGPVGPETVQLIRLCERESLLSDRVTIIEVEDDSPEDRSQALLSALIGGFRAAFFLSLPNRRPIPQRPVLTVDVKPTPPAEQRAIWHDTLDVPPGRDPGLDQAIERIAAQFSLDLAGIQSVTALALSGAEPPDLGERLWLACRDHARPRLDDLAQHIETTATWDDLILPAPQKETLRTIALQVRHRPLVYERWGFEKPGGRGLGLTVLFSGSSGTGKTTAAEVLARSLSLDLYRVDLSAMVSKYIGETEKNLRRVFDAAEAAGAVLLFDEADALFGKRSEVKDSHDRFANIEVSYLLQRMETYRGLAILTTNQKEALDRAFLRRLRFIVDFPFPDSALRSQIWRRILPDQAPRRGIDPDRLAQLNVAGGNIHNIALCAAFLAAEAGGPIAMSHLLEAARAEHEKLGRQITDAEVKGWV
jgi:ATPase family associated with various cellular activities (AAA)